MTKEEFQEFAAITEQCKEGKLFLINVASAIRSNAIIAVHEYLVELATLEFRQLTREERLERFKRATARRGPVSRQVASSQKDLQKLAAWNGEEKAK